MVAVANNTTLTEQAGSFDTKRLRRRKLVDHFSSNQIYILYYEYYNNTKVIHAIYGQILIYTRYVILLGLVRGKNKTKHAPATLSFVRYKNRIVAQRGERQGE